MERGRSARLARIGVGAVVSMAVLSGCSTQEVLRFGWPHGVTDEAARMRELWTGSAIAALVVGFIVWGLIFWVCMFDRKKSEELPKQTAYNLPLEIVYTVIPFLIIAVLFFYTVVVQTDVQKQTANPDVTVDVTGFRWQWEFAYPEIADTATGQPVDVVGTSDEIPVLVIPVDQTVRIVLASQDVIHSFWVPEFLFKRDVIPGTNIGYDNQFEITARQQGAYVGRCAELCGIYHSQMNFEVRVVSGADFDAYTQARAGGMDNAAALVSIGQSGVSTTTTPFTTKRTTRSASGN